MICAREGGQARPDKRKDLNEIKAAVDLDGNGLLSHIVAKFFRNSNLNIYISSELLSEFQKASLARLCFLSSVYRRLRR